MKTTKKLFILVVILIPSLLSAQWNIQTVDNSGDVGQWSDIAHDSKGMPHIVYTGTNNQLMYATWNNTGWNIVNIGSSGYEIYSSIVIDPDDIIHIVWTSIFSTHYVKYTTNQSGEWTTENVLSHLWDGHDSNKYFFTNIKLYFDNNTQTTIPHIVYKDMRSKNLVHVYKDPILATWQSTIIDQAANVGDWNDIAIDSQGHIYVSYYDGSDKDLKFAYYDGTTWSTQIIDGLYSDVGQMTSIVLDENGVPHITYYDETNGNLKHAEITITE